MQESNRIEEFLDDIYKSYKEAEKKENEECTKFNLFSILDIERKEVKTHSLMIYELLNPQGRHGQGDKFVKLFLTKVLNLENSDIKFSVCREDKTQYGRRIDFTIMTESYCIAIEMKIDAKDQDRQLVDYQIEMEQRCDKDRKAKTYYLTLFGTEASKGSSENINYEIISFSNHILHWVEACIESIEEIVILREALRQYKRLIEKLTYQKGELFLEVSNEIYKNEEKFIAAHTIHNAFEEAATKLELEFWQSLIKTLEEKGIAIEKQEKISKSDLGKIIREGSNTEVNIIFEIGDIDSDQKTKLKMQVGAKKNWGNGSLYITIFQTKNNQWDDGPNEDIAEFVKNIQTVQLTKENWCYGTCLINSDIELRSEKLYKAKSHIEELSNTIAKTIKELKESLGQYLSS